jgi:inner membrane protein
VYSHVFLDYLNTYGVRLLTPLDWRWFYGDAVFIIDPVLWVVLGAGIWMSRRGAAPAPSRASLAIAASYIVAMLVAATSARAIVAKSWTDSHGAPPRALMVGPQPLAFTREIIVDAGSHYEWGTFRWPSSVTLSAETIPKNDDRPEVAAAREAANVRGFLVWSRFPFWRIEPAGDGTRVTVGDARFMRGGRVFTASTVVSHESTKGVFDHVGSAVESSRSPRPISLTSLSACGFTRRQRVHALVHRHVRRRQVDAGVQLCRGASPRRPSS